MIDAVEALRRWVGRELGARAGCPIVDDAGRRLEALGRRAGVQDRAALVARLEAGDPALREAAVTELTVGETWLFRDPEQLAAVEARALPALGEGGRPVSIWSAGCATGEEVHALGFLARRAVPGRVTLLGTDVDPARLAAGRRGRYPRRAARGRPLPPGFAREVEGELLVEPRPGVELGFAVHNLARERAPAPGRFDLIACRNVLLYFHAQALRFALETFAEALAPGGWLVLGPHDVLDRPDALPACFVPDREQPFLLRHAPAAAAAPPPPPPPRSPRSVVAPPPARRPAARRAGPAAAGPEGVARGLVRLAQERLEAGDARGAEQACLEALDRAPGAVEAGLLLAAMALDRGEPRLAKLVAESLEAQAPGRPDVARALERARRALGE